MKNVLAENMLRFGTKNLTELHLKNILTEAKAPVISQASVLNVTVEELQPLVNQLNNTFISMAKVAKQNGAQITVTNKYIQLNSKKVEGLQNETDMAFSITAPDNEGNDQFGNIRKGRAEFPFRTGQGTVPVTIYTDPPRGERPDPNAQPASYNLERQFILDDGKGSFNKTNYDKWFAGSKNSMTSRLNSLFCTNPKPAATINGVAAIIAFNGQVRGKDQNGFGNNSTIADVLRKLAGNVILYNNTQLSIRDSIKTMVDKKYAQFAASITSQTPG
tara:strand:+ start:103 stop:927 length:825 start_codon:yes stop_codon:yes gene_type:complete